MKLRYMFLLISLTVMRSSFAQIQYPGKVPGSAAIRMIPDGSIIIENKVVKMIFHNDGSHLTIEKFENKETHKQLDLNHSSLFKLMFADSTLLTSDNFILKVPPEVSNIPAIAGAINLAERYEGKKLTADLISRKAGLRYHWEVIFRDNSNYIRQFFTISNTDTVNISKIVLIELPANTGIDKIGTVDGSPLANENMFFAIEHPMGQTDTGNGFVNQYMLQLTAFTPGNNYTISTVWGVAPANQLRRGFHYYTERERSAPYHQLVHYNSWYDISWADLKFNESQALDRIRAYRENLIDKRHTRLDAFLFDDGWDDERTLWQFNKNGFPDGFDKLKEEAHSCKSTVGVWMSPFGGYGTARDKRIEYGKTQVPPFETNANGFSLSGPVYYQRFLNVARKFITDYDISIFKFDGVGPGNDASGAGVAYHNDIDAFLKLLKELKQLKPSVYLDLTTGTWPSVYWLFFGDNTWRSGDDNGLAGEGPLRQQGITYRDANTYKNVVRACPLYPLTALMNGGLIIGDHGLPGKFEMDGKDVSDDIWSFFGSGVSLSELYINPHKLSESDWDVLARAIKWARENEPVLADAHWVGGDPGKGEVYGYAAWSPERAVLMLRNPSGTGKSFEVNARKVFDITNRMKSEFRFYDAITGDTNPVAQGAGFKSDMKPFEVKVFTCIP